MPENSASRSVRLDPRSPFVLDTRELGRRPGRMRKVTRQVPAPAELGLDLIGVPEGALLNLGLRLESVLEGVLVSGTVTAPVVGECGRCLETIRDQVRVNLQELYAYPDSATDTTADEDEVGRVHGDLINVEPLVREMVVLALPSTPLCGEDCRGLCPDCGVRWVELPADHLHDQMDPRWAALKQLADTTESQE